MRNVHETRSRLRRPGDCRQSAGAGAATEQLREKVTFPAATLILSVESDNYRFGRRFRQMRAGRGLSDWEAKNKAASHAYD